MRNALLSLLLFLIPFTLSAQQCRPFVGSVGTVTLDGLGYAKYLPTTAKRLTDAPTAGVAMHRLVTGAIMTVSVQAIRYRTDGVNPTATNGTLIPAGAILRWSIYDLPKLKEFRFIEVTSGAVVDLDYCWGG